MQLDATVDVVRALGAIRVLNGRGPVVVRKLFTRVAGAFVRRMVRDRMSGRPGLIPRSASMRRSLTFATTGTQIKDLATRIGFRDAHVAMYARVHELGTVGAGGSLPDIVPKRARLLAWRVYKGDTGAFEKNGWAFARRVAIPPRLKFYATFYSGAMQTEIGTIIKDVEKEFAGG